MARAVEATALIGVGVAATLASGGTLGPLAEGLAGTAISALGTSAAGFSAIATSLAATGVSMAAGIIANALTSDRGMAITTRQAAQAQQICYGQRRVGGSIIKLRTSGSSNDQMNYIIVLAGHEIHSIQSLYLDGREVVFLGSGAGWSVRNGIGFGGVADNNNHTGPNGVQYNLGGSGHKGIYAEARYGEQVEGDVIAAMTANCPEWAADANGNSPWVGGCAYIYLKIEFNTTLFPQEPDIRVTINGKCDLYDPRTGQTGFSNNWAVVAGDIILNPVFGLGESLANINMPQWVAACNVCDEQIDVAAQPGSTEDAYTCNYVYDTSVAPGDALNAIMNGANGSYSQIGGQYYLWPDYWQGPSASFGEQHLTAPFVWKPYRSVRDLINRVEGTWIAPVFPYSIAGNLYDKNGFSGGQQQDNFGYAYTAESFPQYACDPIHGFPTDEFLAADGGHEHPLQIALPSVLSITQAQRVAKLMLLHNRQQGTTSFEMSMSAYVLQPKDVFMFTSAAMGWTNKLFEVTGTSFRIAEDDATGAPTIRVVYNVRETDISCYTWTPNSDERTVYDLPAAASQAPFNPAPPTNVTLQSGPSVAQINPDGTVNNLIVVEWDTPQDNLAVQIQIQYQLVGASSWLSAPATDITLTMQWISNVVPGSAYNVQVRSTRANGSSSAWVQVLDYLVEATPAFIGTLSALIPQMEPIIGLMPSEPGADVTSQQPISYTGSSESIIPNGSFILGNLAGWVQNGFTYGSDGYGLRIYSPSHGNGSGAQSPSFQVVPGQKYRVTYNCYNSSGGGGIYLRIGYSSTYAANIDPNVTTTFFDFANDVSLSGGSTPTAYAYDWTCPAGINYASTVIYCVGDSDLACKSVSCVPYAAAAQWGADQTGQNTSNDTNSVDGVPSSTIAQVVPTGYKLYINSGARSYSIQAL